MALAKTNTEINKAAAAPNPMCSVGLLILNPAFGTFGKVAGAEIIRLSSKLPPPGMPANRSPETPSNENTQLSMLFLVVQRNIFNFREKRVFSRNPFWRLADKLARVVLSCQ